MTVVINGTTGITNPNSMTIGNGGGSVATNTAVGTSALANNSTGLQNSAFGNAAGYGLTTGSYSTAIGYGSLGYFASGYTTGDSNTAIGHSALGKNTTASNNTAVGYQAGYTNTTGEIDAFGKGALYSNTTGSYNTAIGQAALNANTTGASNTAIGRAPMAVNTTGNYNTAIGHLALFANSTASNNTAVGYQAGYTQSTAYSSVFVGRQAGYLQSVNPYSTFVGDQSGYNATGASNTFIGAGAGYNVTTGSKNTILGGYNGNQGGLDIRTASNYIVLSDGDGNPRLYIDVNGNLNCQNVYNTTTAGGANVNARSDGFILRSTSALKYKQDVRDVEDFDINALRPIRYKSKCEGDDQTKDHLGLIADEAAEAGFEELVTRGADGEVEGFQYDRLTVVLLKKLQTLSAQVEAQAAEIAALKNAG